MKQHSLNEKGLTLVEVLAALVILSIIFVGVMTIFPQMTLFNAKTETKLDTMNLARQEMSEIETAPEWAGTAVPDYLSAEKITDIMTDAGYTLESTASNADFLRFQKNSDYIYQADIYLDCEPFSADAEKCAETDPNKLYKVHLKILKNSQISSETYSYITYTVGSAGD